MTIAILIRDFYPQNRPSGVISCLNELLPNLNNGQAGQIIILTNRKHGEKEIYTHKGITILKISQYNIVKYISVLKPFSLKKVFIISSISRGNALFLWWYLVTLKTKNKAVFYQTTNLRLKINVIQKKIRGFLIKKYDKLIVTNKSLYEEISSYDTNQKIHIVYPGTNIPARDARKVCKYQTVSFVGHWSLIKGTDIVLKLSTLLPQIKFQIIAGIGKNPKDKYLYRKYVQNKYQYSNVEAIGYTRKQLKYIEKSDLFILPYRTGEGVLGIAQSAIEAMALGIPVLSTKNSSIEEILQHGKNGYICETIENYRNYILKVMNDNALYEKLSQGCLKTYEDNLIAKNKADEIVRILQNEDI